MLFIINMNNLVHTYSESILDSEFSEIKNPKAIRKKKRKEKKSQKNPVGQKIYFLCVSILSKNWRANILLILI